MAIIQAMEEIQEDLINSLSDEDVSNLELNIEESATELKIANENFDHKANLLVVAMEAYDDYQKKNINFDQFRYSVFAAESAVFGIEGAKSLVIANELAVVDRLTNTIREVLGSIKVSFSKFADYLQYSNSWFTLQRGKTNGLRSRLQHAMGSQANIRIGVNKYMRYGENQNVVRDMKEYNDQYLLMAGAMMPFCSAMADLTEEDLFSSIKLIKEGLVGDPEAWFKERFFSVERNLKAAGAGVQMHTTARNNRFTELSSPILLGCSGIVVRMPEKSLYRSGTYEELFAASRYFYAYVNRPTKVRFSTILDGSVHMDVKKNDLIKNLDASSKLVEAALKLTAMGVRISNDGASIDGSGYIFMKRKQEESINMDIFETMTFYRRICSMIYDSVSSAYNFSMGNIKQMNRIASTAADKL